jgi:peptidoglycan hydrolase-like protein with peptidoglycan-binding domain
MPDIRKSVGNGGVNDAADVIIVQRLLNRYAGQIGTQRLSDDGRIGPSTITAIRKFQTYSFGIDSPNGRADPGGRTIAALNGPAAVPLSGAQWWHAYQGSFTGSTQISDLHPDFRDKAARFINALRGAGAQVVIGSTRRNAARAYLMHYCWRLERGQIAAGDIPAYPGCAVDWDHGNTADSRKAAAEMSALFALRFEPSLTSRHIEGKAIDMQISWTGKITVKDAGGNRIMINAPSNGAENLSLHNVGASYGVFKLLSDPPHWSSDGR